MYIELLYANKVSDMPAWIFSTFCTKCTVTPNTENENSKMYQTLVHHLKKLHPVACWIL